MKRRRRNRESNAVPAAVSEIPKGESMNSKFTLVLLGVVALVLVIGAAVRFPEINVKSFTEKSPVRATSKDNAALQGEIAATAFADPQNAGDYVRKYGFDER